MKKLLRVMSAGLMLGVLFAGQAAAQRPNPKLKVPPPNLLISLPDLLVGDVSVNKSGDGFIDNITIEFKNGCGAAVKGKFDIMATFKENNQADSKVLHTVSSTFDELAGGKSHKHFFSVSGMKIPATSYILVEVDPANQIKEDLEDNNWKKLNPNGAPFPPNGSTYCKPKKLT